MIVFFVVVVFLARFTSLLATKIRGRNIFRFKDVAFCFIEQEGFRP